MPTEPTDKSDQDLLSSDRPEVDPERDALGYGPLAEHLARGIAGLAPEESTVLGVYAPWGSGKSTLLNFIEHYLEQLPEEKRPVVLRFNPWWFSGDEALARHFFGQLDALLASKLKSIGKALRNNVASFAQTVSSLPGAKFVSFAGTNVKELSEGVATSAKGSTKDVVALKKEIGDALKSQEKSILVVIDDVDRLTPEEVRQIFKMVKAVADFPKVVYLLAFDKEVVVKALASQPGVDGQAYLEKIVQVPIELPVPDEQGLGTMFFARLNSILGDLPQEEFDDRYWNNVFFDDLRHFLRTPRDVVRLTNSLSLTFPAVKGEVNAVDFIAVEALRVFEPALYDFIRRHPERFSGVRNPREQEADTSAFRDQWMAILEPKRRKPVEDLLARIFPNTGRTVYFADAERRWRRDRRVCSREVFPVYFRFSVAAGSISSAELRTVLETTADRARFAAKLREYIGRKGPLGAPLIDALLGRLEDHTEEDIPDDALHTFAAALMEVGDEIVVADEGRPRGMFEFGAATRIGRLFRQTLRRLPTSQRFPFLREQFADAPSLGIVLHQCVVLGQEQGRNGAREGYSEDEWMVSAEQLGELQHVIVARIRTLAERDGLLRHRSMSSFLHYWIEWGDGEVEAREWASGATSTNEGSIQFVSNYVGESQSQAVGDVNVHRAKKIDLDGISKVVNIDSLAERLRFVDIEALGTSSAEIVILFSRAYDSFKSES